MSIRRVLPLVLAAALAAQAAMASGPYSIALTAQTHDDGLVRTEYTVKAGANPLDRFKMIRIARDGHGDRSGRGDRDHGDDASRGSILFLPPLGLTNSFYEQRDPNGAVGSSIAEFFATRGFDVYGYSPRFEGIPAGTCEAGALDCSIMATWDLASMVDDIAFVRSQIEILHPHTRIVTGGASLGGILAVAVANAHPNDWDGVIEWEGMLYSRNAQVLAINQGYCTTLQAQLAAGLVYDGVGTNVIKMASELSSITPGGLTPIPLFPPNLTNHQTLVAILSTPTPGPATMPTPNYVLMNGSLAEDRLFNASEPRVYDDIARFNSYSPLSLIRDVSCSLAGVETQFTSNLGSFHGAVLALGAGRGFGPYMADQLALFGSTDKTFQFQPTFGHIDHFMTPHHRDVVEEPILQWVTRLFDRR